MGRLRYGIDPTLEEVANEILRKHLAPLPRSQKQDVLTDWKERNRKSAEVYSTSGSVDPAIRRGMFNRAWNSKHPHLNARDGYTRPRRISMADDETPHWEEEK